MGITQFCYNWVRWQLALPLLLMLVNEANALATIALVERDKLKNAALSQTYAKVLYRNESYGIIGVGESLAKQKLFFAQLALDTKPQDMPTKPLLWSRQHQHIAAVFSIQQQGELDQLALIAHGGHLKDSHGCGRLQMLDPTTALADSTADTYPVYDSRAKLVEITTLNDGVSASKLSETIKTLEELGSRYHNLASGIKTPTLVEDLLKKSASGIVGFSSRQVFHDSYDQASVIARIEGQTNPNEIVIMGAHLDSISSPVSNAPGADDNATGIASLVEIMRLIAQNKATFARTIEFHAYGVEEIGLIGSKAIAKSYKANDAQVVAMMQLDMTAFFDQTVGAKIYVIANDTHPNLSFDLAAFASMYTDLPVTMTTLPQGTSDHKSWYIQGYPTAFAFENPKVFNPHYHSPQDSSQQILDLSQAVGFVKLAVGFLGHEAGLLQANTSYEKWKAEFKAPAQTLPMAIFGGSDGKYQVAVTSLDQPHEVQICLIAPEATTSCKGLRRSLKANGLIHGRPVYISGATPDITLNPGASYRLEVFDRTYTSLGVREFRVN